MKQCSKEQWERLTHRGCTNFFLVLEHHKMLEEALKWPLPYVKSECFGDKFLAKTVFVSITPYGKRGREE